MLHEVLLALSGHPSPLFPAIAPPGQSSDAFVDKDFPLLSSSEAALLATVGKLASLHRQIRDHATRIVSQHPSTICRAIAASLLQIHLARFREKILDVEKQILTKDAAIVGAYNIVRCGFCFPWPSLTLYCGRRGARRSTALCLSTPTTARSSRGPRRAAQIRCGPTLPTTSPGAPAVIPAVARTQYSS